MATWTEPKTWSAERSKLSDWNTYLQQNTEAIKNPPTDSYAPTYTGSAFATTTSTSWVAIGGSYSLSLDTAGGDLFCQFSAAVSNAFLDFAVDGTRVGGNDGILIVPTVATYGSPTRMIWLVQELAAGTHTLDVYWKVASGTGSLSLHAIPQLVARELS